MNKRNLNSPRHKTVRQVIGAVGLHSSTDKSQSSAVAEVISSSSSLEETREVDTIEFGEVEERWPPILDEYFRNNRVRSSGVVFLRYVVDVQPWTNCANYNHNNRSNISISISAWFGAVEDENESWERPM